MGNLIKESPYSINKAVGYLKSGKVVALKSETVYGLACDPGNLNSINKVYDLKKRPLHNPLIIHVNSIKMANKISQMNKLATEIAEYFWPGPLTLILPKKKNSFVNDLAISGLETIAIRFPDSKVFLKIINKLNKPIAAPSANRSGYISSTNAYHVQDCFGKKIDLILNSGNSKLGLESTILDLSSKPYSIKRLGMISYDLIKNKFGSTFKINDTLKFDEKPNSPGLLSKHYSPKTPLKLNVTKPKIGEAYLIFGNKFKNNFEPSLNLSKNENLFEAAKNLFDYLRKLDKLSMKRIAVSPIPNKGIGKTINERLYRASQNE